MKDNRLIAEFMEYELQGELWVATMSKEDDTFLGRHLLFRMSWDWLMPVVSKCHKIDESSIRLEIGHKNMYGANIDIVYEAVVEFIKEFNLKSQ